MTASDALEQDLAKAVTGQATSVLTTTPLAAVWVALFTGTLSGDTPGTEIPATNGYNRVNAIGKFAAPSAGSVATNDVLTFPTSSGAWASSAAISHFGLFDASTGGNALVFGALTDPTKTVAGAGETLSIASGGLVITVD